MLFDACFTLVTLNNNANGLHTTGRQSNEFFNADSLFGNQGGTSDTTQSQGQSGFQLDFNQGMNPDTTQADTSFNNTTVPPDSQIQEPLLEEFPDTSTVNFETTDSVMVDSMLAPDTLFLDSTARMEQFRYHREDVPYTPLNTKKRSKFFAYPSTSTSTRNVQLDSTGKTVEIVEKVAGQQTKILLRVPLDEYIQLKMKAKNRESWEQIGYKYQLKESKDDLSSLITDFTNIDIPLPSAGFLSIFGPPNIKLSIGGAVDIHGAWRNETREGTTANYMGNTRNEPDFKQQVQINVNGTIGDKLSIRADWNTERTFEYENQLKLKYTGYEDEIVKNVEAGNVSLQTSSLVGGSEALFGLKADFQFGPLSLTTLASQKKGEVKEVAVTGGSTSQQFSLHAYDYSKNHYFLDTIYASRRPDLDLFYRYYGNPTPDIIDRYRIVYIEVWKTATGQRNLSTERQVNAFINLPMMGGNNYEPFRSDTVNEQSGKVEMGRFVRLSETEYTLHPETGFITFNTQIQDNEAIAVAYRVAGATDNSNDDEVYGEFVTGEFAGADTSTSRKLVLKLIKPKQLQPAYRQAWKLQLKNIYPIGGRKVNEEGFVFDIQYILPGQEAQNQIGPVTLLNAFGLDEVGSGGTVGKDGNFDFKQSRTIFPETGEIVFPVLEPFGRDFPEEIPGRDTLKYQAVYDTSDTYARQSKYDRFLLTGKYSAASSSVFSLGFVGVVENSVKVLLGGRELTPNVDYVVDYNIGQVTIKNAAALVAGADLKITYEQNDMFQLASKTLLGARGLFNFSPKTQLGFSILNLNQQTLSDKVRIGEEPLNNSIYGLDFKTSVDLPFVTKGLNAIIPSKQMSSFSVGGEFAYINPDPNTKKSTVLSDRGESIAYIDDFEGAKRTIPIGISYTSWKDLSVPDKLPFIGDSSKSRQMAYKAKSFWFNVLPSDVDVTHIWPQKEAARGQDQITVLDFVYDPGRKGFYNWYPRLDNRAFLWGGMMKKISESATNLVEENIEFIEFWMKLDSRYVQHTWNPTDSLYIDLGKITEDVIPNGILNSEDQNENDLIDQGEDLGLDELPDTEEPGYDPVNNPDPSGDNYSFSLGQGDYSRINGTEKNSESLDAGRFPDTEDLNRTLDLNQLNSYFRYSVPLDTFKTSNPYITGGGNNDRWFQIRIPIKDFKSKVGDPSFSIVEHMRIWVAGVSGPIHLRIAELNLVGSQWQKVIDPKRPQDSTLTLSVVNFEDNPDYQIPNGVQRERDRTNTEEQLLRNEQSLALLINKLYDNEERQVVKYLRPMDLFNYKEMKLFIHGDTAATTYDGATPIAYYRDTSDYASEVYFRFGSDTTNYYEYRLPVQKDWQELSINFAELTAIKQLRSGSVTDTTSTVDSTKKRTADRYPVSNAPGHYYRIRGNPALTRISFFMIGVENPKNKTVTGPVSGDIWVNELRVIGADDSEGWAYTANAKFNLGDLMTVNFNMSQTNPYFHKLADRFGTRLDARNWGFNIDFDVLKIIPFNLPGSNLKVNYSRTEQTSNPLYVPGTDIKVGDATSQMSGRVAQDSISRFVGATKTLNISETWTLSGMKFKVPSQSWIWNYTINAMSFSFNFNKTKGRSPQTAMNQTWVWNANIGYQTNLSQNNFFYPADIPVLGTIIGLFTDYRNVKIYYTPQSFTWNFTASRNYSYNLQRLKTSFPLVARDFKTTRNAQIGWKLTEGGLLNLNMTYGFDFQSSLAHLLSKDGNNLIGRSEREIWNDIFSSSFFGKNYQYQQNFELRTQPKLPTIWDLNKYFTVTLGYGSSYQWQNNFQQPELGRGAGFSNKINAGITLKLKSLSAPLFKEDKSNEKNPAQPGARDTRNRRDPERQRPNNQKPDTQIPDTTGLALSDSLKNPADSLADSGPSKMQNVLLALKSGVKWLLFDYETIQFNFSQDNTVSKSGIRAGGTGFVNFFTFSTNDSYGPSRAFMLGLSQDVGPRALNGNLSDNVSQRNSIDFRTARPLWEGATIDLKWKVGWQNSKTATIQTDSLGGVRVTNMNSTGSISRSFFSIPYLGDIKKVHELYDPESENLNEAFTEGMEAFPIFAKIPILNEFMKYIPRPNWSLTWDGLEKYSMFKSFTKRVSLQHAYNADYSEGWKIDPDGRQVIQTQKISYQFAPLIGLNMTFASLWNGNFTGSIKYGTKTGYDLGSSTKNITESSSKDIGISATYSKSGFELPLFGLSLKNDIELTFSYTYSKNSVVIFNMTNWTDEGVPQDGTVRQTMEPRVKYVMSSKVTLSIFYRRSSVTPEGAARISPTTTNEAGLDVHIAIQ